MADPSAAGGLYRIDKVLWSTEKAAVLAYAVRIKKNRTGGYKVTHKQRDPMEEIAIDEAQEWVGASALLNEALSQGRGI